MTVRLTLVGVAVWLVALTAVASAQTARDTADRADRPSSFLTGNAVESVSAEAGAPPSKGRSGQTPLFLRFYVGVGSTADVTGVGLAGGVAARPFRRQNMEVEGDLSVFHYSNTVFGRDATANVVEFTGDFLYNFRLSRQKLVPFAGGGLVVGHGSGGVNHFFGEGFDLGSAGAAGIDLVGGVQLPVSGETAFRGELHVHGYAGGSAVIVSGGLSFRLR